MAPHPDPLFDRPAGSTIEKELSASVAGSPPRVFALLAQLLDPRGESHFAADPVGRRAVLQGDHWYRGEYLVESEGAGAVVRFTLLNIAPGWHVLGALTGRKAIRDAPREFGRLIEDLAAEL